MITKNLFKYNYYNSALSLNACHQNFPVQNWNNSGKNRLDHKHERNISDLNRFSFEIKKLE